MKNKGIATQTIFMIVIGLAVVGLITVLVVRNVGTASTETQCENAKNNFCRDAALNNYDGSTNWDDYEPSNTQCPGGQPTQQECQNRGYR